MIGDDSVGTRLFWIIFLGACAVGASWLLWRMIRWHWRRFRHRDLMSAPESHRPGLPLLIGGYALMVAVILCTVVPCLGHGLALTMRYKPDVALMHPLLPSALSRMASERALKRELELGIETDDLTRIRVSLAMGADPSNPQGQRSYLNGARSLSARRLLLAHGAPVDGLPQQEPPLLAAIAASDPGLIRDLLERGADLDAALEGTAIGLPELLVVGADDLAHWLRLLTTHGVDLNQLGEDGLSILDRVVLEDMPPEWPRALRVAGATHGLLLDRGEPLSAGHPAWAHVRQWLEARLEASWPDQVERWQLPSASESPPLTLPAPTELDHVVGRASGDQALVELRFRSPSDAVVVALRRVQAERALDGGADGEWRVSGYWSDYRSGH